MCRNCQILIIIFFLVMLFGCKTNTKTNTEVQEPTREQVVNPVDTVEWSMQTYGTSGLSFESPILLVKEDISEDLAESIRAVMSKTETYMGMINEEAMMMSNFAVYQDGIPLNLEQAAQGSVNEMLRSVNGDLIEMTRKDLDYDGKPAILQEGSAFTNSGSVEFKNLIIMEAPNMWQVSVLHKADEAELQSLASRIISSVAFN